MQTDKDILGKLGEDIACRFLISKHYKILERNYKTKTGEIDIIAEKMGLTAFVEVKTRSDELRTRPSNAVNATRQKRMINTAKNYLKLHPDSNIRFDIIEIVGKLRKNSWGKTGLKIHRIEHIERAFYDEG